MTCETDLIHIVFDGPPGPEAGRFVDVETEDGKGVRVGTWQRHGDLWHLVLPTTALRKIDEADPDFKALQAISEFTPLYGELLERDDLVAAVEEIHEAAKAVIDQWEDRLGDGDVIDADHPMRRLARAIGQE